MSPARLRKLRQLLLLRMVARGVDYSELVAKITRML